MGGPKSVTPPQNEGSKSGKHSKHDKHQKAKRKAASKHEQSQKVAKTKATTHHKTAHKVGPSDLRDIDCSSRPHLNTISSRKRTDTILCVPLAPTERYQGIKPSPGYCGCSHMHTQASV